MLFMQAVQQDVESRISNTGYITGYCGGIIMTLIAVAVAFLNAAGKNNLLQSCTQPKPQTSNNSSTRQSQPQISVRKMTPATGAAELC